MHTSFTLRDNHMVIVIVMGKQGGGWRMQGDALAASRLGKEELIGIERILGCKGVSPQLPMLRAPGTPSGCSAKFLDSSRARLGCDGGDGGSWRRQL